MTNTVATDAVAVLGDPSERTNPRVWEWLKESKIMAVGWLALRVWLGVMWIQAGWAKLWGAENAAFLHHNGAGVAGFATHAKPAYTWWGSFLHSFVVPNSGWIGVLVAVSELVIGVALVAGLFTRIAALGSLALLFTYVMSGTASVCAFYALVRHRHPDHVEDRQLDRRGRTHRRLPPAPPRPAPLRFPPRGGRRDRDRCCGQDGRLDGPLPRSRHTGAVRSPRAALARPQTRPSKCPGTGRVRGGIQVRRAALHPPRGGRYQQD